MLTEQEIKNIAKINGLKPYQQEKHYIQTISLTALSEEPLVFKGGTYLWFFNKLPRFSEDLDFTAKEKINTNLADKTSKRLEQYGVENELKIVNENNVGFSFRISARGPLNKTERDICYLYIEISKRESVIEKTINYRIENNFYGLPTTIISGMNFNEVAAEKVRAIITRNKARDLYDLAFLLKNGVTLEKEIVNKKMEHYGRHFDKKEFLESLKQKKQWYQKELTPLLFSETPSYEKETKIVINWLKTI